MEIAAAKAAESLYDFVKDRLKGRKKALAVLEAADGTAPQSSQVLTLADELQAAGEYAPAFAEQLLAQWALLQSSTTMVDVGSVTNRVSGTVHGAVIQARNILGNITLG